MTNPSTELTALHELAKSCPGGVEGCEWWPGCVRVGRMSHERPWTWRYVLDDGLRSRQIEPQHALDLVERHAERWLVGKGWSMAKGPSRLRYCPARVPTMKDPILLSLHDALKHAIEHTTPKKEK